MATDPVLSLQDSLSGENPPGVKYDSAEPVVLPMPATKKAGGGKKVVYASDADAARIFWRTALTKIKPTDRELATLDPVWSNGVGTALAEGHVGVAHFLVWVENGNLADRLSAIKLAIESAQDEPEEDEDDQSPVLGFPKNDLGNARRLVHYFGDRIRFHIEWKAWLIWDKKRWKLDRRNQIIGLAKKTVQKMTADALKITDDAQKSDALKFAVKSGSRGSIENMVKLAESEHNIAVDNTELDTDSYLFNCKNGTLDLRSGQLRLHRKEDLITNLSPVAFDPSALCPLWDSLLNRIMGGDAEMISYLGRAVGYSLTAETSEQCFFFLYGTGANGKSTFLSTIERVLGKGYAASVDPSLFTSKEMNEHSTEICDLDGPRCIITSECEERQKLAEAMMKRVTGGTDKLRARRMRANPYEFSPKLKLWMAGNHEPVIRGTDEGIWRRVRKVPFLITIPDDEKDPDFPVKLQAELPGILAWCVRGCLDWQAQGLKTPIAVNEATEAYRADSDPIAQYLDQRCDVEKGSKSYSANARELYNDYRRWCGEEGINHPLKQNSFGRDLTSKGFVRKESNGRTIVYGLSLKGESFR